MRLVWDSSMRNVGIALGALVLVLASSACQHEHEAASGRAPLEDVALFTDVDVDAARLTLADAFVDVVGLEREALGDDWEEVPIGDGGQAPVSGEVVVQAVLPDAEGLVAFIRSNPNLTNNPWMVYVMDQHTDSTTLVYGGRREIQSVSVSADGDTLLVAMRRTIDESSDFEVFRLSIAEETIERLTATSYDESNVSMSADGAVLVWEGENEGGARAVFVREDGIESHLVLTLDQREPSVSGNGRFIGLVRTLASGNPRVVRYDRSSNAYQVIWGQDAPVTLSHPSTSDDGSKVSFLEYRPEGSAPTERQLVRYLDVDDGTVGNVAAAQLTDGPRIAHPHLARDGDHLTYAFRQGDVWNIFTRRVSTGEAVRIVASAEPVNNDAPFWQMGASAVDAPMLAPVDSGCDAEVPVGSACSVRVGIVGSGDLWRGAEFDLTNAGFAIVDDSARLEPALLEAGCFTANGPVKVVVGCTGTFEGGGPLVSVSFTRSEAGPSMFVVDNAALVTPELELLEVLGGSLQVD